MSDRDIRNLELNKSDIELLFQLFWLPYSNGPKGELLINEFKFLRDQAHLVLKIDPESEDDLDDDDNLVSTWDDHLIESPETEFLDSWMERASSFNNVCKRYSKMCDKFTFIENRELFFDINSYLNNLQVILSACNRFLKWVGLERCRKPIQGGPTLSGLPGGIAGDLHRLFVVKSNFEYPLRSLRPTAEKNAFQIQTYSRCDFADVKDNYFKLFCESVSVEMEDVPSQLRQFIVHSKLDVVLEEEDAKMLGIECDDVMAGLLVATKSVKIICERLKQTFSDAKGLKCPHVPINIPIDQDGKDDVPWQMIQDKSDFFYSLTLWPELLYTKQAHTVLQLMHMIVSQSEGSACILVDRSQPITRQFLLSESFREIHKGKRVCVLVHNHSDQDQKAEKMEEQ